MMRMGNNGKIRQPKDPINWMVLRGLDSTS